MNEKETDFNVIIQGQLVSLVEAKGISTELKMQDGGFQITLLIERMEENE